MVDRGPYEMAVTGGGKFSYDSDFDIVNGSSTKTGLYITVHGSSRTATTYYNSAVSNRARAGKDADYAIFAPQYLTEDDVNDAGFTGDADYLWWGSGDNGWRHGGISLHGTHTSVDSSSFAVMDQMINHAVSNMPNLTHINISGNSAGGGFCSRYPVMTMNRPKPMKFIPVNFAGMWFRNERPSRNRDGTYYTPNDDWNHHNYPYGTDLTQTDPRLIYCPSIAQMRTNVENSEIVMMTGYNDRDPMDSDVGKSPAAMYQGHQRMERGDYIFQHYTEEFPTATIYRSKPPNVEHSNKYSTGSPEGLHYCFTPEGSGPYTG